MTFDYKDWQNEIVDCKQLSKQNKITKGFKSSFSKIERNDCVSGIDFISNSNLNYDYVLKKNESLGIDRKLDKKLKSGNFVADIRVDFHGLKLDEAFDYLIDTIKYAYDNGLKFVLVVTGKGYGTKLGKKSIKSQIEHWMTHPDISSRVVKYVDAQQKDGGTGAIYVLVKSNKSCR